MSADRKKSNKKVTTNSRNSRQAPTRHKSGKVPSDIASELSRLATFDDILEYLIRVLTEITNSERGSLFLHDPMPRQLYTKVALGEKSREIRVSDGTGIAGSVFSSGEPLIVNDPYQDARFNKEVDERTGFVTKSIVCVPIHAFGDTPIGVLQMLNQREGDFSEQDVDALLNVASQCAATLYAFALIDRMEIQKQREMEFVNLVSTLTSELDLSRLLTQVVDAATEMLGAERATIFLNDEKTDELFSLVGAGLDVMEIRLPNHAGIAGAVFKSGKSVNIPHAYADLRFNPSFDKQTGFFTRSVLGVPIINQKGERIGVTQVLNKAGGPFTREDEGRIKAFTAQIAIGLENAKLFKDITAMQNYTESMLHSMSNGVVTVDESSLVKSLNSSAARILGIDEEGAEGRQFAELLDAKDAWLFEEIDRVRESGIVQNMPDADIVTSDGRTVSANLSLQPLISGEGETIGALVLLEDISSEKRVRATMSRYMDPQLASQLLQAGDAEAMLGGQAAEATILFTDIRGFTTISEELGATGTVGMLNEYFELLVSCITDMGGMVDKFIGDAMMAAFGVPIPQDDAPDQAVKAAIDMLSRLRVWNKDRLTPEKPKVEMGVGINTDMVVTGNIGSSKRMDFTMIGDGVNLASRIEGACKSYGAQLIISEHTREKLHGIYALRELDRIVVKGKTEPVSIHEVLDFHDEETFPKRMYVVDHFTEGLRLYRARQFEEAVKSFSAALSANGSDVPSKLYIERCRVFQNDPPPEEWSGEWVMTEK